MSDGEQRYTTVQITKSTRKRLSELKPYPSVSYDDLLMDMADQYEGADS